MVTAHDGFTLRDLVSYNDKHNEANGEGNRDGSDDNRSWNCGHEGETDDPSINALRHRQAKNIMATMCLATGVPMITAGDEMGRTQGGNNNAYCQDSPISWVSWDTMDDWQDLYAMTREILRLRAEHPVLRPDRYRYYTEVTDAEGNGLGRVDLTWFNEAGAEMDPGNWHDPNRRTLGMYSSDVDEAFLTYLHAQPEGVDVTLPGEPWAVDYRVVVHSGFNGEFPDAEHVLPAGSTLHLPGRSVALLQVTVPPPAAPDAEETTASAPEDTDSGDGGDALETATAPGAELDVETVADGLTGDEADQVEG